MTHPHPDEIELSIFGPGYGECQVIHVGSGNWAIIDSCLDDNGKPAAISYLESLGVDIDSQVSAVVATHWHDDHIKGLSSILDRTSSARFALSAALREAEFLAFLSVFDNQPVRKLDRGATEMLKCLKIARRKSLKTKAILEDTIIVDWDKGELAHGYPIMLRALSPPIRQYQEFLARINGTAASLNGTAKKRLMEPGRNDLSIATYLEVGETSALLGADLEEKTSPEHAWSTVLDLRRCRNPKSFIFKVPHHGSSGAHNVQVWSELLHEPISVTTPWKLGGKVLPTTEDRARLVGLSAHAYLTSEVPIPAKKRYERDALKQIKFSGTEFSSAVFRCGHVQLRWRPTDARPSVQLANGALRL